MPEPKRFRKKAIEVEAVQHADGVEFPLSFLRRDEAVRKCAGSTSIKVFLDPSKITIAIVPLGHWLIRWPNGDLFTLSPKDFEATYEPIPAPLQKDGGEGTALLADLVGRAWEASVALEGHNIEPELRQRLDAAIAALRPAPSSDPQGSPALAAIEAVLEDATDLEPEDRNAVATLALTAARRNP